MITLLAVTSIWNITLYLFCDAGVLSAISPMFVIAIAIIPNVAGLFAALSDAFDSGYDKDTRLMLLSSLSPIIAVTIYHLALSKMFSNPIELFIFANGITITLSITVLVLLTLIMEWLTPTYNDL